MTEEIEPGLIMSEHSNGEEDDVTETPPSCCRCGVGPGVFDIDSCLHSVCIGCRFDDSVRCLLCGDPLPPPPTEPLPLTTNGVLDGLSPLCSPFRTRRVINKDHIVNVEDDKSSAEGSGEQKQVCMVCQRVFKRSNARYHYGCATGDKPHFCQECGQKFVKKSHLEAHLNGHYGIKPFKCTIGKCKASFVQKDKLVRHMKTHNKEVKFVCPVCDKDYSSQQILDQHLANVHTSAKPYQCELCPRVYKYERSLRIHRLKHSVDWQYMCEVCGKTYVRAAQLRLHSRSHVVYTRRPFKCSRGSCGRRFISRRDRARHQLIHTTTSRDFECSLCNTTFGRKDNLERHMKNFHHENPPQLGKSAKLTAVITPFNKTSPANITTTAAHLSNTNSLKSLRNSQTISKPISKQIPTCDKKSKGSKRLKNKNKVGPKSKETQTYRRKSSTSHNNAEKHTSTEYNTKGPSSKTQQQITDNKTVEESIKDFTIASQSKLYQPLIGSKLEEQQSTLTIEEKTVHQNPEEQITCNKSTASVIISPNQLETQNRPSVIKTIPKLLPYRVLPPDKRFLKMSEDIAKGKSLSELMPPPLGRMNSRLKTNSVHGQKRKVQSSDALNRCYRIIYHTNAVQVEHFPAEGIVADNIRPDVTFNMPRGVLPEQKLLKNNLKESVQTSNLPGCSSTPMKSRFTREHCGSPLDLCSNIVDGTTMKMVNEPRSNCTNGLGGPSLAAGLPENPSEDTHDSNFNSPYVPPHAEPSLSSYTPYFENECFKESVHSYYEGNGEPLLPNDLDIGFQYITEQLGCAEMNFSSESRIMRYVSQETRVVRESFT